MIAVLGIALLLLALAAVVMPQPRRFSARYRAAVAPWNRSWQDTRKLTLALSWGRDCVFPWLRAREVDHLGYGNLGAELPWIDVVPLHPRTHAIVTRLRRIGLRGPVNLVLRLAYGAWIAADAYALLLLLSALRLVRIDGGIPTPPALARMIAAAVGGVVSGALHLLRSLGVGN